MASRDLSRFGLDGLSGARLVKLGERSAASFFGNGCLQLAAAIAYHALLSIFPLVIFAVWASTWFVDDERARSEIVDLIADQIALSADGEAKIATQLKNAAQNAGAASLVAIPLLIWAASSMMTSLRNGINVAWNAPIRRQFLRGKLLDIGLVALLGVAAVGSVGLTLVQSLVPDAAGPLWSLGGIVVPIALSFLGFMAVFLLLPSVKTYARDVWPAALFGALILEVVKLGFAFYLGSISSNDALYGSVGAIISLLLFVFVTATVVLFVAAIAAELPRVRAGVYDTPSDPGDGGGILEQIKDQFRQAARGRPEEEFRKR